MDGPLLMYIISPQVYTNSYFHFRYSLLTFKFFEDFPKNKTLLPLLIFSHNNNNNFKVASQKYSIKLD